MRCDASPQSYEASRGPYVRTHELIRPIEIPRPRALRLLRRQSSMRWLTTDELCSATNTRYKRLFGGMGRGLLPRNVSRAPRAGVNPRGWTISAEWNGFVLVSFWRHVNVVDRLHACVDEEQGEGGRAGAQELADQGHFDPGLSRP